MVADMASGCSPEHFLERRANDKTARHQFAGALQFSEDVGLSILECFDNKIGNSGGESHFPIVTASH
eukprot:scaffold193532_cov14-Prasinocladus_malaysianus.AAC.1